MYWSQQVQLRWQQFLLIFLRTDVIFSTKNKLDNVPPVQFLTGRRTIRSFSPGADDALYGSRRLCDSEQYGNLLKEDAFYRIRSYTSANLSATTYAFYIQLKCKYTAEVAKLPIFCICMRP